MEPAEDWLLTDRLRTEHGKGDPFAAAVRATRMAMIITDPALDDNPIVFANAAFLELTGYERDEVMGRNCRFLQGPETDQAAVQGVREAVEERRDIAVDLLNYRRDGTPFWNALYLSPVINEAGELQYFFASQLDITHRVDAQMDVRRQKDHFEREVERRTRELRETLEAKTMLIHEVDHRVKNNLQMISGLIALQARSVQDPALKRSLVSLMGRVEAVGTVHRRLYQSQDVQRFDVAAFVRDLANDLVKASGREDVALELDAETIEVPASRATPLALMLNEIVTDALTRPSDPSHPGRLAIGVGRVDGGIMISVENEGREMAAPARADPFGARLVDQLSRQLGATVRRDTEAPRRRIEIEIPISGRPRSQA